MDQLQLADELALVYKLIYSALGAFKVDNPRMTVTLLYNAEEHMREFSMLLQLQKKNRSELLSKKA